MNNLKIVTQSVHTIEKLRVVIIQYNNRYYTTWGRQNTNLLESFEASLISRMNEVRELTKSYSKALNKLLIISSLINEGKIQFK